MAEVTLTDAQMQQLAAEAAKLVIKNARPVNAFKKVTDYSNGVTIPVVQRDGTAAAFDAGNFFQTVKSQGDAAEAASYASYDNVFIMTHRCKTCNDNFPLAIKPQYWKSSYSSETPEGILVIEGGHHIVVALEEATSLPWSSGDINGNTVFGYYGDRQKAFTDFNGQQNTKNIIAASGSVVTNTSDYAPGYCNNYSVVNANGKGMTAGKWWLPSIGELLMIYANMTKINYAISVCGGTPLSRTWYWSSSEGNAAHAWNLPLHDGSLNAWFNKSQGKYHVRPVSAFLN